MTWQPIETAPKDKRIIVWTGRERYVAHWVKNIETDDEAWMIGELCDGNQAVVKAVLWHEAPALPVNVVIE